MSSRDTGLLIGHGYFDIDVAQVFSICRDDIATLIDTIREMIEDLRADHIDLS